MVEQARMKLAVLRRLFAGGLLTEARARKHKRHAEVSVCSCGLGEEDTKYQAICAPMLRKLPQQGRYLPVITKYAALSIKNSRLTHDQIQCLQETLVIIWQQHIRSFYAKDVNDTPPPPPPPPPASTSSGISQQNASIRQANGHALAMLPSGGMSWRKCGKQCARLQHIKLKITKKPSPHADKDKSQWLTSPEFNLSSHRLDMLQEELEVKYSKGGHELTWNRQIGKVYNAPNEGLIHCSKCQRLWRWKDRVNNLPRSKCVSNNPSQSRNHRNQSTISAPKFRICGKQTPQSNTLSSEDKARSHAASSGATHRTGVGWEERLETRVSFALTKPRFSDPAGFGEGAAPRISVLRQLEPLHQPLQCLLDPLHSKFHLLHPLLLDFWPRRTFRNSVRKTFRSGDKSKVGLRHFHKSWAVRQEKLFAVGCKMITDLALRDVVNLELNRAENGLADSLSESKRRPGVLLPKAFCLLQQQRWQLQAGHCQADQAFRHNSCDLQCRRLEEQQNLPQISHRNAVSPASVPITKSLDSGKGANNQSRLSVHLGTSVSDHHVFCNPFSLFLPDSPRWSPRRLLLKNSPISRDSLTILPGLKWRTATLVLKFALTRPEQQQLSRETRLAQRSGWNLGLPAARSTDSAACQHARWAASAPHATPSLPPSA